MLQSQTIEVTPRREAAARSRRLRQAPARRWVGTLICRTAGCNTELAEVFADEHNLTYLPQIGAPPLKDIGIPCPKCGKVRRFESVRVLPPGVVPPPANVTPAPPTLTPAPDEAYDPDHN